METWQAIATFRAVRRFADRSIEAAAIDRILDAGRRAPSSKNEQRWAFVVCTEREHLQRLSETGVYAGHVAGAAAAIALVTPEGSEAWENESIAFDLGQATQNMMLAAWDLGIGSCHASVYQQDLARDLLGFPSDHRCDYLLSLGYPEEPIADDAAPRERVARRPVQALRHDERWNPC